MCSSWHLQHSVTCCLTMVQEKENSNDKSLETFNTTVSSIRHLWDLKCKSRKTSVWFKTKEKRKQCLNKRTMLRKFSEEATLLTDHCAPNLSVKAFPYQVLSAFYSQMNIFDAIYNVFLFLLQRCPLWMFLATSDSFQRFVYHLRFCIFCKRFFLWSY